MSLFGRKELSPTQQFSRELGGIVGNIRNDRQYLIASIQPEAEVATVHLYTGDVEIPRQQAYGVMDRFGRQEGHYIFLPHNSGESIVRSAIHPSVPMPGVPKEGVLYRADYTPHPDGGTMETWLVEAREYEDDWFLAELKRRAEATPTLSRLKAYTEPLEAKLGVW